MQTRFRPPVVDGPVFDVGTFSSFPCELEAMGSGQPALTAWPTANLAIFIPLYVEAGQSFNQLWWYNGTITGGTTMEVAVYDEAGQNKLATTGVISQSGGSTAQVATLTGGLYLPRGRYWVGMVMSNNTTQVERITGAAGLADLQKFLGSSEQQMGSTALPAQITFGAAANSYVPYCGLSPTTLTI